MIVYLQSGALHGAVTDHPQAAYICERAVAIIERTLEELECA